MKRPRLRALVLTAGYGVRLRPLTFFLPKPILPVAGEPVVGRTLRGLRRLGCEAAVLNLHHLVESIPACLGQSYHGLPLVYSREQSLLGTLGPLHENREFLRSADAALLVNGDTLCDWPWRALLRRHLRAQADATLLLHRRVSKEAFGGGVGVGGGGRIVQFREHEPIAPVVRKHVFAGAHVLSPRLLERIEAGSADIVTALYQPLLEGGGHIASVITSRRWHDLGTGERYLDAVLARTRRRWRWLGRPRNHISPLASVSEQASVEGSVIEAWAVIEKDVRIEGSVVLPGARISAGSSIHSSIIGPGVRFAAATNIERRMVNRVKTDHELSPHDTVMGNLVYTPLAPAAD